ncbi:MAG: hypothetical protein HY291_10130 [Planctomycetes bacterium]|nr:hypothetical protein [Planctomycetota bacterium]
MAYDDVTLQELIVRALTGLDKRARASLEVATAGDPDLKQFCDDLDQVVNLLAGCKDWRAEPPSQELTAKIRKAVAEKLPAAPPHFRTVLIEADLGRRKSIKRVLLFSFLAGLVVAAIAWLGGFRGGSGEGLRLSGVVLYEASLTKADDLKRWETLGDGAWAAASDGSGVKGSEAPSALVLKDGFDAKDALAFEVDAKLPGLDEQSGVVVFWAEGSATAAPGFNASVRPERALSLEITRESLVLTGPEQVLLQSAPTSSSEPRFIRIRLEHLGDRVRALINGKVFFEGSTVHALRGRLFPGVRLVGSQKVEVRFNAARVER